MFHEFSPRQTARAPRLARRSATAAAACILALTLSGCARGGANAPASTGEINSESGSASGHCASLNELSQLQADRAPSGPATACLADSGIVPVSSSQTPQLPVTVTDQSGSRVTVTSIDRVLALDISGTLASTVVALGLGSQLVGRDTATTISELASLPNVTQSGHTIAAEPILTLRPSLLITDGSLGPNSVLEQLRASGVSVVLVDSKRSLDTVEAITQQVAAALGVPERGAELSARLGHEIAQVRVQIGRLAGSTHPRVAFLYLRGSASIYYLFGSGSGADTLIDALDAEDVATEAGWSGMKPLNAEALIATAPDVLLVMTKGLESIGGIDGLLRTIPAVAQTPAGKERRVIDMDDSEILGFGPRTAEVLGALAQALYAPSTLDARG